VFGEIDCRRFEAVAERHRAAPTDGLRPSCRARQPAAGPPRLQL